MQVTINEISAIDRLNSKFDDLVPASGKAPTVAGEIVRAVCRIGYRYLNDGDQIGIDYGNACNAPARYLLDVVKDSKVKSQINKMWGSFYRYFKPRGDRDYEDEDEEDEW